MKTLIQTGTFTLASLFFAMSLTACHSSAEPAATAVAAAKPRPAVCQDCGTISHIEQANDRGKGTGIGAVIGAVAGAVVGHQFGDGRGQDAATVGGAAAGGYAGNEIEKQARTTTFYRVTVAMKAGGSRTVSVETLNGLSVGDRVRVIGDNLQIMG